MRIGGCQTPQMLRRAKTTSAPAGKYSSGATARTSSEPPSRPTGWLPLGRLLVTDGSLSADDLTDALAEQTVTGQSLGEILSARAYVTDGELAAALARQRGMTLSDLGRQRPTDEALAMLPEAFARAHVVLPLEVIDGTLRVILGEPNDAVLTAVETQVMGPVEFLVAPAGEVRRALDSVYRVTGQVAKLVEAFQAGESSRTTAAIAAIATDEMAGSDDAPVVRLVSSILTQALRDRTSDVHIEPQTNDIRVRFRIDGALHDALTLPGSIGPALVSRLKILAGMNIVERRRPQDGQFSLEVDGRSVDVRVSTVATIAGEKCVLRLLDKSRSLLHLGDLGMPAESHAMYSAMARSPFGMVVCAGPTGSGKTTTLYATLAELNESHRNIMTIEDPVEYIFPSVNQIQTNEAVGMTFATGLRSILRQDPDVILVGECRDVETARIAVQSALTGHFVLSTIHATDSVAALHRLLDMGIESFLLASSILGIVGQRLVRRNCESCREEVTPTSEELAFYQDITGHDAEGRTFWRGTGCNFCADTGFKDRIGVYELLKITPELKRLIVGWATQDELRRLAVGQGMRTLEQEAVALAEQGTTTLAEVIRTIYAA